MINLKVYNLIGERLDDIEIDESFTDLEVNSKLIKDYIVAIRHNARQWSANTKGRSEVSYSGQKPHRQKGTGRARQGFLGAAQYRGGGVVFGPKPKFDQNIKINKKEKRKAIRYLIVEKMKEGKLVVLKGLESFSEPKTKTISNFLSSLSLGKKPLFVSESESITQGDDNLNWKFDIPSNKSSVLQLSIRNIEKASFSLARNLSGYKVMCADHMIITEGSLKELQEWLLEN